MTGLLTGQCHLKWHSFNLGLENNPECERYNQTPETTSHVLCDCEALAALKFRHLGHFTIPGNFENISLSRKLHFVQSTGLLNVQAKGLHKRPITLEAHRSLWCPTFCILSYSKNFIGSTRRWNGRTENIAITRFSSKTDIH
jgi:hypothetical protein